MNTSGSGTKTDVLELRIHGVNNSPPAYMLGVPADEVASVASDTLGGFFALADPELANKNPRSGTAVPPGVRREAYSWGGLGRYAPALGGGSLVAKVTLALSRVAWLLLTPFALCNCAYWARPLPGHDPETDVRLRRREEGWKAGNGAAAVRVFALILTLIYVMGFASVSLDLVGVQCFSTGTACTNLPSFLDGMAPPLWTRDQRLALMSVVPVAATLLLYVVAMSARVKYESRVSRDASALHPREYSLEVPILATPQFWQHRFLAVATERVHMAAALALVGLLLFWDATFASVTACAGRGAFSLACYQRAFTQGPHWLGAGGVVAGFAMLAWVLWLTVARSDASSDVRTEKRNESRPKTDWPSLSCLWAGIVLYACAAGFDAIASPTSPAGDSPDAPLGVLGLVISPMILVTVAIGLAVAGLGWRRGVPTRWSFGLFAVLVLAGIGLIMLLAGVGRSHSWAWWSVLVALATVIVILAPIAWMLLMLRARRRPDQVVPLEYQGWHGKGPGLAMFLALVASMTLTGLLVIGIGRWLAPVKRDALPLSMPKAYTTLGETLILVAILMVLALALVAFIHLRGMWVLSSARPGDVFENGELSSYTDRLTYEKYLNGTAKDPWQGQPPRLGAPLTDRALLAVKWRRVSALAQLGEPIIGWFAAIFAVGAILTVFLSAARIATNNSSFLVFPDWVASVSIWVLGTAAFAVAAGVILSVTSAPKRPIGLFWDLICFLPRAGHPFAPPCYAERAVPELRARIEEWLHPTDAEGIERPDSGDRRVIVSAWSQGVVLAVCTIFNIAADGDKKDLAKIGLITYGTQLRPYFGRFLPELLGPTVTGANPCRAPSMRTPDPWQKQIDIDQHANTGERVNSRLTLRSLLTDPGEKTRWTSLWRRTDFIGFPVDSYGQSVIDRGAEEYDRTAYMLKVATHFDYHSSAAYESALTTMVDALRTEPVVPPSGVPNPSHSEPDFAI